MRRVLPARLTPLLAVALAILAVTILAASAFAAGPPKTRIQFGPSMVALNGPWKFSLGDDPRWSDPAFDDSQWENVDLAPAPGAQDPRAGAKAAGWDARGHAGYAGIAWYRLQITTDGAGTSPLAISGPSAVDGAYELYVDGDRKGGVGAFRAPWPVVRSQQPRLFQLPAAAPGKHRVTVIAIRVWSPSELVGHGGGGVRAAPQIGLLDQMTASNRSQWLRLFEAHAFGALEAIAFLVLALMAVGLVVIDETRAGYVWLLAALTLTFVTCANQALFFWTQAESLETYDSVQNVILAPGLLAAWLLTWQFWFDERRGEWQTAAVAALTGLYMAAALGSRPWFQPDSSAHGALILAVSGFRIAFIGLYLFVVGEGIRTRGSTLDGVLGFAAASIAAVALFGGELTFMGVKAVWYPFGVAVTRTEYVFALLIPVAFAMIVHQFVARARLKAAQPQVVADGWGPAPTLAPLIPAPAPAPSRARWAFGPRRAA